MRCPRTGSTLKPVQVGGITVDISLTCGGVFFDHLELQHFDEKHERRGQVLVEHLKQFVPPKLDLTQRIQCPKCIDVTMQRHFYSPKKIIEVDECPSCGGFWFDYGELEKIRTLFPTKADRENASRAFEENILHSAKYHDHIQHLEAKEAMSHRISNIKKINSFLYLFNP
ncbi:zf-TFIIB domain-containing protein [uncultured Shewanella sp.]|uniref:TFIIB-type zinc ribbon-containing protein n=1 Tax=uncultured Shewanella sp. TaxID=173975 RepID=UPI0026353125|nr:zf-TFIIB domain-containing protein [uncultured Shewanella sp.]